MSRTRESEFNPQWLMGGNPGAIEQQEADGQESFCKSTDLPIECLRKTFEEYVAILESLGIKCGEKHDIFMSVELPEGWKKVATDHSMHNYLVDDRGRKRAGIFYKAAFYDRHAHINFETRFKMQYDYDHFNVVRTFVTDGDVEVFSTEPVKEENGRKRGDTRGDQEIVCAKWLIDNGYPEHEDPTKYWD